MSGAIAVTGASGHVGAALLRALLERGEAVRALDVRPPPGLSVDWRRVDVLELEALKAHLRGVEVVFHLAAKISIAGDPDGRVWDVNVDGVRNVAAAALANGARRLIHCSSVHAFDCSRGGVISETSRKSERPSLPVYDVSKAAGERAALSFVPHGLDVVIANPTGIVGPFDYGPSRMGRILLTLSQGRLPAVVGGGFDWVDVRDVAAGLLAAERAGRTGENYLLAGHHASLHELAALMASSSPHRAPRWTVPWWLAAPLSRTALQLAPRSARDRLTFTPEALHALRCNPVVDGTKARTELQLEPRPLEATVADTLAWFEAQRTPAAAWPRRSKPAMAP